MYINSYYTGKCTIFWLFLVTADMGLTNGFYVFQFFHLDIIFQVYKLWNFVIIFWMCCKVLHNLCRLHDFSFLFIVIANKTIKLIMWFILYGHNKKNFCGQTKVINRHNCHNHIEKYFSYIYIYIYILIH